MARPRATAGSAVVIAEQSGAPPPHRPIAKSALFLEVARQGALNLTTISYSEIDADVQRILDSSTGTFRDDFQNRSQPFIDIVKQARSKSECTIIEVGLESVQRDTAQALVAVTVKTSNAGAAQQQPPSCGCGST